METQEFKNKYGEEGRKFEEYYRALLKRDYNIYFKVADFIHKIEANEREKEKRTGTRRNLTDYEAYHIAGRSTPDRDLPYFDLEGEDSILAFVESLEREFESADEK